MKKDAEKLILRLHESFSKVTGPPKITLSVARGMDDYKFDELKELAHQHRHHLHWLDVTEDEIEYYHDCWAFMDSTAFQFYLPAFIHSHLKKVIESNRSEDYEPAWFPLYCITLTANHLSEMTPDQVRLISDYLLMIEKAMNGNPDVEYFRPTRHAWESLVRSAEE